MLGFRFSSEFRLEYLNVTIPVWPESGFHAKTVINQIGMTWKSTSDRTGVKIKQYLHVRSIIADKFPYDALTVEIGRASCRERV